MGLNNQHQNQVKAKKQLGQHFLTDLNIASNIADALRVEDNRKVIEVGPGMGVLTQFLLKKPFDLQVAEIDRESVVYLEKNFPDLFTNSKAKSSIDYFHSTLIYALFKKFEFGYVVLTFGVGDCPIAVVNKDKTISTLMNWLDVGEFGGGTRFITQGEIFHSESNPMSSRFNFQIFPDFSYMFLMTDGIYDPKFVVEANLEKSEKWQEFIADLEGNNDDNSKVDFNYENQEIELELSKWMDFWSPGNHDDRTLAIIY
jgi:phospholipid N-methyltransferase